MVKLPIVDQVISFVRKPQGGAPRHRDERVRAAVEQAPVGIALVATDGRWLQFNERFHEVIGYTREQLGRMSFHDLTHPDDAKIESALVRRLLNGDIPNYRIEKRIMEKKGKYRDITVVASLVKAEGGDCFIYIVDEPPKAVAKTSSRENEHQLAAAIDHIAEVAIIRTDTRGTITAWNAGAERVFGYSRIEAIGKPRRMLYRDPDNWEGKATKQLEAAGESGRVDLEDWRVAKNGAHVWVHVSITPVAPDGIVRSYIEVVTEPGPRDRRVTDQVQKSAEAKTTEMRKTIDDLRAELTKRERTEESLRGALEDLRQVGEETMNELRIMTAALRKEMDRRKVAEEELRQVKAKPPVVVPPPVEEQIVATAQPKARSFKKLKVSPSELLVSQASDPRTGALVISSGEREVEIFFEKGKVFSVSTNDPSRFLTQRLIAIGMLTEEQREKALEIQRETHLAIGRILMILGVVTEEELLDAMRRKAEEEILAVMEWDEAKYAFVEAELPTLQLVPLRIDVAALVVQQLSRPAVAEPLVELPPLVNRLADELRSLEEDLPRLATELEIESIPLPPTEILIASASGKSKKFHRPTCPTVKRLDEDTRIIFTSEAEAANAGYEACRMCFR